MRASRAPLDAHVVMKKDRSLPFLVAAGVMTAVVLFISFEKLPVPTLIPCTYPLAQSLAFALCGSIVIHLFLIDRTGFMNAKPIVGVFCLFLSLIFWLGSYPFSPMGFSSGRIPTLRGFLVTRFGRPAVKIASGEIISMPGDSIAEIHPITLPVGMACTWVSVNGGALEDPRSCDIAYLSPDAAFDTLKLLVQPACHLPDAVGEIKVSILP
jgi:hypothetical protein